MTPCKCDPTEFPFDCPVHHRRIGKTIHAACKSQPGIYETLASAADATPAKVAPKASRLPLGDAVAAVTTVVGIKPCPPCLKRKKWLNDFGDKVVEIFSPAKPPD